MWSYSSEFFRVIPSESIPANKNMYKDNGKKKTLDLRQLMLFQCLNNYMEYIFQVCDGVCFLIKLQAFPIGQTYAIGLCRFTAGLRIQVFKRNRYKNKQVQIMGRLMAQGSRLKAPGSILMHMKMLVDFTHICSKPPTLKL